MKCLWKLQATVALVVMAVWCASCIRTNPQLPANTPDKDPVAESLLEFNRLCLEDEKKEIAYFIDSVNSSPNAIEFLETEDGTHLRILTAGTEGRQIEEGNRVSVAYSLELLDGTICSQSTNGKAKEFTVGKREVEKGLDLAVIGLRKGTEFEVVIPYSLAWGVTGNMDCIPPRTPILYRIKIVSVN